MPVPTDGYVVMNLTHKITDRVESDFKSTEFRELKSTEYACLGNVVDGGRHQNGLKLLSCKIF